MQFPKTGQQDDDEADPVAAANQRRLIQLSKQGQLPPGQEVDAVNARRMAQLQAQAGPTRVQGSMPQANGVPSPAAAQEVPTQGNAVGLSPQQQPKVSPNTGATNPLTQGTTSSVSSGDDIRDLVQRLKQGLDFKAPTQLPAGPPQRPQIPDRPQQQGKDLIPQLLGAAGTIFSARSYNPHNWLGDIMGQQKAKRDEQYNDQLTQLMNDYQGQKEQYQDTLMRHQMELHEHEKNMSDTQGALSTLLQMKYLGMPPQDQLREQRLMAARQELSKMENPDDVRRWRAMKAAEDPAHKDITDMAAENHLNALKATKVPGPFEDKIIPPNAFSSGANYQGTAIRKALAEREAAGQAQPLPEWWKERKGENMETPSQSFWYNLFRTKLSGKNNPGFEKKEP